MSTWPWYQGAASEVGTLLVCLKWAHAIFPAARALLYCYFNGRAEKRLQQLSRPQLAGSVAPRPCRFSTPFQSYQRWLCETVQKSIKKVTKFNFLVIGMTLGNTEIGMFIELWKVWGCNFTNVNRSWNEPCITWPMEMEYLYRLFN